MNHFESEDDFSDLEDDGSYGNEEPVVHKD